MRTTSRSLLLAACLLLLAGCSGSATPPDPGVASVAPTTSAAETAETAEPAGTTAAAPTNPSGTPNCATSQLAVTLGEGEGAAGSTYRALVFQNTGGPTCELRGFPGVSYVAGDDGHQVGPAAAMSGERGGEVRLGPGGSAAAQLQLANVQNFDAAVCKPTAVRGLRVYPPGETASVFVPFETTGCAGDPLPSNQLAVATMTAR